MKNQLFCIFFLAPLVFTGCASAPDIGDAPSDPPPRLTKSGERDPSGRELLRWDRPKAFGKVEGQRKVMGDTACMMARPDLESLGYHPMAEDADGVPIVGGGYYCYVKNEGDAPSKQVPRLLRTNGILGWDKPAAFGAVPAREQARGDVICGRLVAYHEAVAFHPAAQDEEGKPISGGGFLCGPKRNLPKTAN